MKFFLDRQDPARAIDDLNAGLTKLTFADNFQAFRWEGAIASGQEVSIRHNMTQIPKYFLVVSAEGANNFVKGSVEWTIQRVSIKNADPSVDAKATILFFG